jgi:cytochrome c-type biogenesis protein CcmF
MEMGFGDSLQINGYKIVCQSYSQDTNPEYDTDFALLDVYRGSRKITQLTPEKRLYFPDTDHAQPSTVVAIHQTLAADLYVVFEGQNPDSGKPIIKAIINPLVNWVWIGVGFVIFGTAIALVPPLKPAPRRVEVPANPGAPNLASETWAKVPALSTPKVAPHA